METNSYLLKNHVPKIPLTVVLDFVGYVDLPNLIRHINLNNQKKRIL